MSIQRNLKVSIYGKEYPIVTDEDEMIVQRAAHVVDLLLRKVAEKSPLGIDSRTVTLVALQIATDLVKQLSFVEKVESQASALNALLDKDGL
jgi:cell division protein ZapA (FtsZ GTPase activity inhibitor)